MSHVAFDDLSFSDLTLGTVYLGGTQKNSGDDPIAKLLPVGNQGGFRYSGSPAKNAVRLVALYTNGEESEWPDHLDETAGTLTYFGDNRMPGRALLNTRRRGNVLLRNIFAAARGNASDRALVPPLVLFEKVAPRRDVRFRGLLAPGIAGSTAADDLRVVRKKAAGGEFENYQARFTVLNSERVSRTWIDAVTGGVSAVRAPDCPSSWRSWVDDGTYEILPHCAFGP
jgi:hypothetical protein